MISVKSIALSALVYSGLSEMCHGIHMRRQALEEPPETTMRRKLACSNTVTLLSSGKYIDDDANKPAVSTGTNATAFIRQETNGNVAVYTWDTTRGERKICETGQNFTIGDYWTLLQADGNFLTYRGNPTSKTTRVWKTNVVGPTGTTYNLKVRCDDTVAIYKGDATTNPLWTCPNRFPTICQNTTLLKSGEFIDSRKVPYLMSTGPGTSAYIQQDNTGNVAVYTKDMSGKVTKIAETSQNFSPQGNYWSKLQGDGNFLTYRGTPQNTADRVWKTNKTGGSASGILYFLRVNCDKTVAIYKGTASYIESSPLWTMTPVY